MSREEALARRNFLVSNRAFQERVANGDQEALDEMMKVCEDIVGTEDNWQKPPENFGRIRDPNLPSMK